MYPLKWINGICSVWTDSEYRLSLYFLDHKAIFKAILRKPSKQFAGLWWMEYTLNYFPLFSHALDIQTLAEEKNTPVK